MILNRLDIALIKKLFKTINDTWFRTLSNISPKLTLSKFVVLYYQDTVQKIQVNE